MRFLLKAESYMLIALIRKLVFPDEHSLSFKLILHRLLGQWIATAYLIRV